MMGTFYMDFILSSPSFTGFSINHVFISGAVPPNSLGACTSTSYQQKYLLVRGTVGKAAAVMTVLQNNINLPKALTNFYYNYILVVT
jgi:hypothetical protein